MQTEREFIQKQLNTLQQRLSNLQGQDDRPASSKLLKAFEVQNRTLVILKQQLKEIMGDEDAFEMVESAQKEAEQWYEQKQGPFANA